MSRENYIIRSFMICTGHQILFRMIESRRIRWTRHVACMGDRTGACTVLIGRPERKRPRLRPRCRWENNIKINLQEVGWAGMDWIELVQGMES